MVVFYHGLDLLPNLGSFSKSIFSYFGFLGVELFFVLSGFLIGGILIKDFQSQLDFFQIKRFWLRRWFRTLPNYYLFFLINVLLMGLLEAKPDLQHLIFLQNFAWRMPDTDFFGESWSLSIEEWFYIFLPLFIFGLSNGKKRSLAHAILATIVVIALFSLFGRMLLAELGFVSWRKTFRKIVLLRFDSLMVGVLGAYVKFYWIDYWKRFQGFLGVLGGLFLQAVVLYLYFTLDLDHSFVAKTFLFSLVSFSTLLLIPSLELLKDKQTMVYQGVARISACSYSLYLCNIPISKAVASALGAQIWSFFAYLVLCLALAQMIFKYFESPFLKLRDRFAN